jgi:uncharacterized damage-inducible protein DinB
MQNRQSFLGWWEHFRQVNGISMRIIASLPSDKITSTPIPNMRSPVELLVHTYGQIVKNIPAGIAKGEIVGFDEKSAVASIKTKDDLIRFCNECWTAGDAAAKTITDANLSAMVKTPWGSDMPGFVCAGIINDEYLHHRGQLFTYARALGVVPPMMWDFEHNDAAFAPQASAKA